MCTSSLVSPSLSADDRSIAWFASMTVFALRFIKLVVGSALIVACIMGTFSYTPMLSVLLFSVVVSCFIWSMPMAMFRDPVVWTMHRYPSATELVEFAFCIDETPIAVDVARLDARYPHLYPTTVE